jgi:hypothetical protein
VTQKYCFWTGVNILTGYNPFWENGSLSLEKWFNRGWLSHLYPEHRSR